MPYCDTFANSGLADGAKVDVTLIGSGIVFAVYSDATYATAGTLTLPTPTKTLGSLTDGDAVDVIAVLNDPVSVRDIGTAAVFDVGTAALKVVQLDASARLPAVDGSQLTSLPAQAYITTLKSGVPVVPVTTTAAPVAADSGSVFTNEGDADGATVTLPSAAAGLGFAAYVQAAQTLTVTAASGDTIRIASSVTAAAGSITSSVVGSAVVLQAINATEWVALSSTGSWSF
jgi:hypothetical protein